MISLLLFIRRGFSLCFFDAKIRKLASIPWLIGILSYITCLYVSYLYHGTVLNYFISDSVGLWQTIVYWILWLIVSIGLFFIAMLASILLVFILTASFQSAIVSAVKHHFDPNQIEKKTSLLQLSKEAFFSIINEIIKLIWVVPIFISLFLISFIGILMPVSIILSSWLLAYQFVDVVLEEHKIPLFKRLSFCMHNGVKLSIFGLGVFCVCLIPFAGIFIAPVAVASATALFYENKLTMPSAN